MGCSNKVELAIDSLLEDERVITEGYDLHGLHPTDPAGEYFRATVWCWPPILAILGEIIREEGLDIDMRNWDANIGAGLRDAQKCKELAAKLEEYLMKHPDKKRFVGRSGRIWHSLMAMHALGIDLSKAKRFGGGPIFSVGRTHLEKFVEFLRTCGGFRIY